MPMKSAHFSHNKSYLTFATSPVSAYSIKARDTLIVELHLMTYVITKLKA